MNLKNKTDQRWMEMYHLTKRYIEQYLKFPSATHEFEGERLGQWFANQRRLLKDTKNIERKELFESLLDYLQDAGCFHFYMYVHWYGLLPEEKTVEGSRHLGSWYYLMIHFYKYNTIKPDVLKYLNEICVTWMLPQTKIIGEGWLNRVPKGDIPITIAYSDLECISLMREGIYGCYQLVEHCTNIINENKENSNSEKVTRAEQYISRVLFALFPKHIAGSYYLLKGLYGSATLSNPIDACTKMLNDEKFRKEWASKSIEALGLSVSTYNCFKRAGYNTIGDILSKTLTEILTVRNLTTKRVDEVILKLTDLGMSLKADWLGDSKKIENKVPDGDIAITRVYDELECMRLTHKGIYGCYQLVEHCTKIINQTDDEEKIVEAEKHINHVLYALFPKDIVASYYLLKQVFRAEMLPDPIDYCTGILSEKEHSKSVADRNDVDLEETVGSEDVHLGEIILDEE